MKQKGRTVEKEGASREKKKRKKIIANNFYSAK